MAAAQEHKEEVMAIFYVTKWPLEYGVIVCEGTVTAKQAKIDKEYEGYTCFCRVFHSDEFYTGLDLAKSYVADALLDEIKFCETRIERMKWKLDKVRNLSAESPVWTRTGKDDEDDDS